MEYSISISEILVAVLILISSGLGFIIKEQKEKLKAVKNQLSDKKYRLYNDVYSIFFDLIKSEKGVKKQNEKTLGSQIIDIKKDLLIYAPDNIVRKFIEWNRFISDNVSDMRHTKIFLELYILIRKDMGHPKTHINEYDILKLIMTTDIEIERMKKLIEL